MTYIYNKVQVTGRNSGYLFDVGFVDLSGKHHQRIENIRDETEAQGLVSHLNGGPHPEVLERIAKALESIAQHLAPKPSDSGPSLGQRVP